MLFLSILFMAAECYCHCSDISFNFAVPWTHQKWFWIVRTMIFFTKSVLDYENVYIYLFWCARLHANLSLPSFCFHIFSISDWVCHKSLSLSPIFRSSSSSRAKKHTHSQPMIYTFVISTLIWRPLSPPLETIDSTTTKICECASKYHLNRGYQVSSLHTYIKYMFPHYTTIIIIVIIIIAIMIISISDCTFFSAYFFSTSSVFMRRCVSNKSDWFIYAGKKQLEKVVTTS